MWYWPHMASEVQQTVADCRSCTRVRGTQHRQQKKLTFFPAPGPLELVAMDLYGPLPKNPHGNRHILVITDRFPKLCHAIPLRTTQALQVAQAFLDAWVYLYSMPNILLTDNGPQLTAKYLKLYAAFSKFGTCLRRPIIRKPTLRPRDSTGHWRPDYGITSLNNNGTGTITYNS